MYVWNGVTLCTYMRFESSAGRMKVINFKYEEPDGSVNLGVPENVKFEKGNYRDGGCEFKFETSDLAIGIKEHFSLYLFSEDINKITLGMWNAYLETEPERAKEDLKRIFDKLNIE